MKFGKIMSRIGKKEIIIPSGVEVKKDGDVLSVKGPLGELSRSFKGDLNILIENNIIKVSPKKELENLALWGTFASHISNMIEGVTKGFKKTLLIEGVGFKFQLEGAKLLLNIGLSHPIKLEIPKGIKVEVEKNSASVSGSDKEVVGQFCANIRALKKPEPYKGTGIRYDGEIIRRKAGKRATSTA